MAIKFLNWAWEQKITAQQGKFVLVALADCANETGEAHPSLNTLASRTGQSQRTVINHLEILVALGFISSEKRFRENGSKTSNSYRLLMGASETSSEGLVKPVQYPSETSSEVLVKPVQYPSETSSAPLVKPVQYPSATSSDLDPPFNHQLDPSFNQKLERSVFEAQESSEKPKAKPSKAKKPNFQAFMDLWNEQKLKQWASCRSLTPTREKAFSRIVTIAKGEEKALETLGQAIAEARLTDWYITRDITVDNVMSNDKVTQLSERYRARQSNQAKPVAPAPKPNPPQYTRAQLMNDF